MLSGLRALSLCGERGTDTCPMNTRLIPHSFSNHHWPRMSIHPDWVDVHSPRLWPDWTRELCHTCWGWAGGEGAAEHPGACHSPMPVPIPSRPTYPLRNVPLQPLRRHQCEVWFAHTVPSLRVAQVEDVSTQSKLQGEGQTESHPRPPLSPTACPTGLLSGLLPPTGAP